MDKKTVTNAYTEAVKLTNSLPEIYREEAFSVIFSQLLASDLSSLETPKTREKSKKTETGKKNETDSILGAEIDFSQYDNVLIDGNWAERSIIILKKADEVLGVKKLSVPELATVMTKKLNLPHVDKPNIRKVINANRAWFVKSQEGGVAKYSLSLVGQKRFAELVEEN